MSQSLCQNYLHIVFSTKDRHPFVTHPVLRGEWFAYIAGACKNLGSPSIRVGGMPDHVHILCRLSKTMTTADLVREIKRESSKWIKAKSSEVAQFAWQSGYGAFSVSPSHVEALTQYILNQEEHHRKESFQDEFRRLCRKYGVDLDERYAWD